VSAFVAPALRQEKRPCPETGPDDWAEAKSQVGQRAREEDMRSAGEPGSREEDTIPVRCRDTRSEGGGFGARLSDTLNMNSIHPVDNAMSDMSAMHSCTGLKKNVAPLEGRAEPHQLQERVPARRERSRSKGGGEAPAVLGGDIVRGSMPNNRAGDIQAMHATHAIWNGRFESAGHRRLRQSWWDQSQPRRLKNR
jgi:hypothetical protein